MNIGFIGFGNVSYRLFNLLKGENLNFFTSSEGRSEKTKNKIIKSGINCLNSFEELVKKSDVIISANSPKEAFPIAQLYHDNFEGIYIDFNNVSPKTTLRINNLFKNNNFVDGSIIGSINRDEPLIYLSGIKSNDLKFFNKINTKIISNHPGDASLIKLIRSSYTKCISAILIETFDIAEKYYLKEELIEVLTFTEGENFLNSSKSRIENTKINSKRKIEELEEIISFFDKNDLTMNKATLKKLLKISDS